MRRFFAVLLAAGLVLGACGSDSGGGPDPADDPKGALTNAFENLGEYDGIDMTLSLDTTAEDLAALSEGDVTAEQADTIVNSSINVKASGGESVEDSQAEFVIDIDGSLIEMRFVNGTLYARADVTDLVEKFGGSQADVDAAVAEAPPQYDFVQPLVDGDWVGFEGFDALSQQFGAPTPDTKMQQKFADDLSKAVADSSSVTEEGTDDAGTHLVANVNVKDLYEALQSSFGALAQLSGGEMPSSEDIPDQDIAIDFWVDDGFLTQVGFDFLQIAKFDDSEPVPAGVDQFGILVQLDEFSDGVAEPDATTTVNLQELMGGLMGGLGGLGGMEGSDSSSGTGSSGPEDICATLKDAPPEVQEQFVDQCPEFAN